MTPSDIRAAQTDMDKLSWQDSTGDWNFATVEECEGFFRAHYQTIRQALRFTLAAMGEPSAEVLDRGREACINTAFGMTAEEETKAPYKTEIARFKAMTTALFDQVRGE